MTQVHGVILAAGRSTRMSEPKPLLEVGGETFLRRSARTLRQAGCDHVYVVVNADAEWAEDAVRGVDAELVRNPDPDSEQVESLRIVLRGLPDGVAGIVVLPVDLPLVAPETARALVAAFRSAPGPAPAAVPQRRGGASRPPGQGAVRRGAGLAAG
jgi:molybdenum cofactor cytidylyltransferase